MVRPTVSLLVDARLRAPGPLPVPPDVEVVVAGPDQPVELAADAPEARVFHALVAASQAPLCVWLRAGDLSAPHRIARLRQAVVQLRVPIVAHRPPGSQTSGSGRILRLPGPVVTRGTTAFPDTIAFRREVAAFAPLEATRRHGTRRALLNWAATRDGVGWVDEVLFTRPSTPPMPPEQAIHRKTIATRAGFAALAILQEHGAPSELVQPAIQLLLDRSGDWTWAHWDRLVAHQRPRWAPPPEAT